MKIRDSIANSLATRVKNVKGGYFARERFFLTRLAYKILPLLGFDYPRHIEWDFVLKNLPVNKGSRILDVGCCASLFIHELNRYGEVFGIDSRPYFERLPQRIKFLQSDTLHLPFKDSTFDNITLVSVIEHIGLGAYGDPRHDDGDFKAAAELRRVLKPEGGMFITTVVGEKYVITPNGAERVYDRERFQKLAAGFQTVSEEYYIYRKKWAEAPRDAAFRESGSARSIACISLKKE